MPRLATKHDRVITTEPSYQIGRVQMTAEAAEGGHHRAITSVLTAGEARVLAGILTDEADRADAALAAAEARNREPLPKLLICKAYGNVYLLKNPSFYDIGGHPHSVQAEDFVPLGLLKQDRPGIPWCGAGAFPLDSTYTKTNGDEIDLSPASA